MRPIDLLRIAAVAIALILVPAAAQAPGDFRLALVIGNAAYPSAELRNPGKDADAVSQAVRKLGFQVIDLRDATREQTLAAFARMHGTLQGKRGVGMLYYAGHGVQHNWRNLLVPVDARFRGIADIDQSMVEIAQLLDGFRAAGNRLNLLVLDACRDNPFDNELATKGLAPVDAPPGTFIAFATTAGNVAEDGDEGGHGLYTRHLLQELSRPASRLEDVFKRVRLAVRLDSGGRQVPTESSNLDEEFSFDRGFTKPETDSSARLARFSAEKQAWDRIRGSQAAEDYIAFLRQYPSGFMSEIAQFNLDRLRKQLLVAQPRRDGLTILPSGVNRFAAGDTYTLLVTDRLTGLVQELPQRVTTADNDRVEINGGASVFDQMGGVLKDDSGTKDPPVMMVPSDIALGKRWRAVFVNSVSGFSVRTAVEFKAEAIEDVRLRGEVVRAFRVSMEGSAAGAISIRGKLWIEPSTMRMVRWDREVRAGGHVVDTSSILVVDYRPVPRR